MKTDTNLRKEIIRFLIVGVVGTIIDFSGYYFLLHYFSFSISKGISFSCAAVAGYLFHKFWTFKYNQPSYSEAGRYTLINISALGINVYANQGILKIWPDFIFLSLVIATIAAGLFNFICVKWWVFSSLLRESKYFMWWEWLPWRFLVRDVARRQGFLDPIKIITQLQNFAQPSEVAAPMELVRSGAVLHARGLMNSLAIQHNLDWIWPYWVECQYDPLNESFIPRSFSLTQINLTHRNWTALGVPDCTEFPLVDPRGLVTPFYDSWSIDVWIIPEDGEPLIPSRSLNVMQKLSIDNNLCVITESCINNLKLRLEAQVTGSAQEPVCRIKILGTASVNARLVVSIRPYNPEGVSFVNYINMLKDRSGWQVNRENYIYFDKLPFQYLFSDYHRGDVYSRLSSNDNEKEVSCTVGMASSAALYKLEAGVPEIITVSIPLKKIKFKKELYTAPCPVGLNLGFQPEDECESRVSGAVFRSAEKKPRLCGLPRSRGASFTADLETAQAAWKKSLSGVCRLQIPDKNFEFLFEAAIRTMVLHSPKEVYPGPFIYRRFWFRDAAFILYALLCVGLKERVKRSLDCFRSRQTIGGYFLSQEGEWDSNGEALWIMRQYCEMTGSLPPKEWRESINNAGMWICKKRLSGDLPFPHAGLLPSGFSAEHLGPNDFYYWDDFWGIAGLKAAAFLCALNKNKDLAVYFEKESRSLLASVNESLKKVECRLNSLAIPASPYRRLDTGAIGSLAGSYPLRVFESNDPRILGTADFLIKNCLVHGGFFHDMTHSGINPYLTLHIAQVLLRAGDMRYLDLMREIARLASSTGQWPEAIHPRTGGGCMGDGQHVWAAAEWVLMVRNCFVREENNGLILCSGIPKSWIDQNQPIIFGPAPTSFGEITITIKPLGQNVVVEWCAQWRGSEPQIDISMSGFASVRVSPGSKYCELAAVKKL